MESPVAVPYDWVAHVSRDLMSCDEIPLFGASPQFPWKAFSDRFAATFLLDGFQITPGAWLWRSKDEVLLGLGQPLKALSFCLSPLNGTASILMTEEHLNLLMGWLLTTKAEVLQLPDTDYREAFLRFIAMKAVHISQQLNATPGISPSLLSDQSLPTQDALCTDISFKYGDMEVVGRLVISPELLRAWKGRFTGATTLVESPLAQEIEVQLALEAGKTTLKSGRWKTLKPGDFLVLQSCSLVPGEERGRVLMTLHGRPAFRAMVKKDKVKILEFPSYYEGGVAMDPKDPENKSEDVDNGEWEEFEELGDIDVPEEGAEEETTEEAQPSPAETVEPVSVPPAKSVKTSPKLEEPKDKEPFNPEDLPMTVVVEIGRITMNVKTLLQLQPGNMLDLEVRPEQGVDLVVHGKKIARGELLRIGDTLGVRLLTIA